MSSSTDGESKAAQPPSASASKQPPPASADSVQHTAPSSSVAPSQHMAESLQNASATTLPSPPVVVSLAEHGAASLLASNSRNSAAGSPGLLTDDSRLRKSQATRQPDHQSPSTNAPSKTSPGNPREMLETIQGLHNLHQQGGLTVEEFQHAKQHVLQSSSSDERGCRHGRCHSVPRRRRHRLTRRGVHSSYASSARSSAGHKHRISGAARTSTRSSSASSRRSTTSTTSSSSDDSDHFIVLPRAKVWKKLNEDTTEDLADSPFVQSIGGDADVAGAPLSSDAMVAVPVTAETPANAGKPPLAGEQERLLSHQLNGPLGARTPAGSSTAGRGGGPQSITSPHTADSKERGRYGTFLQPWAPEVSTYLPRRKSFKHVLLCPDDEVRVTYFNSRGASGANFSSVALHDSELRAPIFLPKGAGAGGGNHAQRRTQAEMSSSSRGHTSAASGAHPRSQPISSDKQMPHCSSVRDLTAEEKKMWDEMTRTSYTKSSNSFLEQSLNWYWVDVTGRDLSRRKYNATLAFLTKKFNLCESFLVDREHTLVLPQICESPEYPGQYLMNLRVATQKISIVDDSVMELTNRWIIVVDLNKNFIITLHRVDTVSMSVLRSQWKRVMENNDVSFQEFLLKIIDDAIQTYRLSLDVHSDLLDRCESKLFVTEKSGTPPRDSSGDVDLRILHHFSRSSRSPFLLQLLDLKNKAPMDKGRMNTFLYHLHRRTSVQHRMLNLTQSVLAESFTKLQLCSKELATQMCGTCIELGDRAFEVREDSKTLLDLHISLQTFRTNELMAVLTRVSIMFTPFTFLAGVYGMNFHSGMPELTWKYGYLMFWIICVVGTLCMQFYFWKTGMTF